MQKLPSYVGFQVCIAVRVGPDGLSVPVAAILALVCLLLFIFEDVLVASGAEVCWYALAALSLKVLEHRLELSHGVSTNRCLNTG